MIHIKSSKEKGHLANYHFYTKCPILLNIIYGLKNKILEFVKYLGSFFIFLFVTPLLSTVNKMNEMSTMLK
jgi:hypothetical protein